MHLKVNLVEGSEKSIDVIHGILQVKSSSKLNSRRTLFCVLRISQEQLLEFHFILFNISLIKYNFIKIKMRDHLTISYCFFVNLSSTDGDGGMHGMAHLR